ncbi:hypothetical protein [Actinokineospora terrae]|nr:hypothetical protein [Actinokineospora terrae]
MRQRRLRLSDPPCHTTTIALFDPLKATFDTTGTQVAYADPGRLARINGV